MLSAGNAESGRIRKHRSCQSASAPQACRSSKRGDAKSSTSTWTHSTHPSNSATVRGCAESRSPWADGRNAAAWPRPVTRLAGIRRSFGHPDGDPPAEVSGPGVRQAPFHMYRGCEADSRDLFRVTPIIEPLSLDEAYLDVTENLVGVPRRPSSLNTSTQGSATRRGSRRRPACRPTSFWRRSRRSGASRTGYL